MKLLCNILAKIDAGSEDRIRSRLNEALGAWAARHRTAHTIMAVSENSVAFADGDKNLFVARYALTESHALLTGIRKLLNVEEQLGDHSFLDEFAGKFVNLVAEEREEEAQALVGMALEMRDQADRAAKMVVIENSDCSTAEYARKTATTRKMAKDSSKAKARKQVFKSAGSLRAYGSKNEAAKANINKLTEACVAMLASIELAKREPLIEGKVVETNLAGIPSVIRANGSSTKIRISEEEKEEEEAEEDGEGEDDEKEEKKGKKKDGDKEEEKEDEKEEKSEKKDDEKKDDEKDDEKSEGVIVVNLNTLTEQTSPKKDFFHRASVAWAAFRAEPIDEQTSALIGNGSTAAEIVKATPFLALLDEEGVYEAIAPHMEALDPNDIRAVAKAIVAEGTSKEGLASRDKFITALGDGEIAAMLREEKLPLAEQLDHLLIEAEDFDFGGADDLGADDLGDDQDVEGMPDDEEGGEDMGNDQMDLTNPEDGDGQPITFEMPADKARELLKNIVGVIGDEIEDNEEFDALKSKLDSEDEELTGDDVTSLLQTVGDYFKAVGKDKTDQDEKGAEDEMGSENLDDMEGMTDKGDTEGDEDSSLAAQNPNQDGGVADPQLGG
jgi:hypothetical protein